MPNYKGQRINAAKKRVKESLIEDSDNPVIQAFRKYAVELDDKHDRYERIVKISRDITIEAKRIIFLLHTIDGKENQTKILNEAQQRLEKLITRNFSQIAKELYQRDPYQYRWAYSAGLQEFVEAYTYMEYARHTGCSNGEEALSMPDWNVLQDKMQYEDIIPMRESQDNNPTKVETTVQKYIFFVDPIEFLLGVTDLTGELMRRCINSLGSGQTNICFETCKVLQRFYTGYISLNVPRCRDLSRKIFTMRQSVLKAENACYNVRVRGKEAAKWGGVGFESNINESTDEGIY